PCYGSCTRRATRVGRVCRWLRPRTWSRKRSPQARGARARCSVRSARGVGRALQALHVEVDRQQVLHVERVHREPGRLQIFVLTDLYAVVLLAELLARDEQVVDLAARVLQQAEVVEAGRRHWLAALGEQDELVGVG